MKRSESKRRRLKAIQRLLWDNPEGLTQAEIARQTGVNRSTIHRDVPDLESKFGVFQDADGRLHVSREAALVQVGLSLHEAYAIHMAVRLLAGRIYPYVSHAPTAVAKIGKALDRLAPRIGRHLLTCSSTMDNLAFGLDAESVKNLEKLVLGWAGLQKVRLVTNSTPDSFSFSTYMIEPCVQGNNIQVYGARGDSDSPEVIPLESIESVTLLGEEYAVPDSTAMNKLLIEPWGIPNNENTDVEVVLRFNPQATDSIAAFQWHPQQDIEMLEDGSLLWKVVTSRPLDMFPWIFSWGPLVEVIAPGELREFMTKDVNALVELYSNAQKPGGDAPASS